MLVGDFIERSEATKKSRPQGLLHCLTLIDTV
jgi:hypothetical protein